MKYFRLFISLKSIIAFICITFSTHAYSEETNRNKFEPVETYKDWKVFVANKPKECWGMSEPKEKINTRNGQIVKVRRGDVQLFVNFLPSVRANGQLSFTGGYPFADGSTVTLRVMRNSGDGINFALFTDGEWAWARSDDDDIQIIKAMEKGAKAILTASSSRGTKTQDTFSLLGFTAAVEDAEKRCK